MKIMLALISKVLNVLFLSVAFFGMIILIIPAFGIFIGILNKILS